MFPITFSSLRAQPCIPCDFLALQLLSILVMDTRDVNHIPSPGPFQVGLLLDAMELGHYKDTFSRECVSGEILLECDDDILREDLGVASRLHRLRLAKIIDGRHSAASILEGADPYVSLGAP